MLIAQAEKWKEEYANKLAAAGQELRANPARSDRAISIIVGISKASVYRVRASLEKNSAIPVVPPHERTRIDGGKRRPQQKNPDSMAGPRIKIPDGMTIVDVVHQGIEIERQDKTAEEASYIVGIGVQSYRQAKAIVLLSERKDLTLGEREATTRALGLITKERRTKQAFELVKELSHRVWGTGKNPHTEKTAQRFVEIFMNAISVITVACGKGKDLQIPQLGADDAISVILQLKEASQALKQLRSNLNRRIR